MIRRNPRKTNLKGGVAYDKAKKIKTFGIL